MELREKRVRQAWSPVELDEESGLYSSDGEGEAEFSDDGDDSRECGPCGGVEKPRDAADLPHVAWP